MKVKYQTSNARLTFEFECESDKAIVSELARIEEVFSEEACGCCQSERIRFDVREFDGNHYYKLLCDACGATLDFGQHKNGKTLFVKRHVKDTREPLPNRGWYQYRADGGPKTPTPPKTEPASAPSKAAPSPPAPPDPAQKVAAAVKQAIDGMDAATSRDNLDAWKAWAVMIVDLTQRHRDELNEAYSRNTRRIGTNRKG